MSNIICVSCTFPHKRNNTLSCPQRKKRTKTRTGHYIVPFIRCPYTQKGQYIAPPIRFPRINGATKGTIYYPPYALFICAKGTILCPPHFYCVSHVFHKRANILPLLIHFRHLPERDNILSPSCTIRSKTA